jgi:hypothetical protein
MNEWQKSVGTGAVKNGDMRKKTEKRNLLFD